jgi:hypothetical protein
MEYVANKLGVSVDELKGFMELPKKTFRDYKSQQRIYDLGAMVMKALKLEVGGKR